MAKNGGFSVFCKKLSISFFYTIFCVHALDFTTRYGIIVKHELWNAQDVVFKKNVLTQDIVEIDD